MQAQPSMRKHKDMVGASRRGAGIGILHIICPPNVSAIWKTLGPEFGLCIGEV